MGNKKHHVEHMVRDRLQHLTCLKIIFIYYSTSHHGLKFWAKQKGQNVRVFGLVKQNIPSKLTWVAPVLPVSDCLSSEMKSFQVIVWIVSKDIFIFKSFEIFSQFGTSFSQFWLILAGLVSSQFQHCYFSSSQQKVWLNPIFRPWHWSISHITTHSKLIK